MLQEEYDDEADDVDERTLVLHFLSMKTDDQCLLDKDYMLRHDSRRKHEEVMMHLVDLEE